MNTVTVIKDVYDASTWETVEVADVRLYCTELFISWPKTAKIYLDSVAKSCDVTPYDEGSVEKLGELQGHFYIVIFPEGIETIFIIVAIAIAAVSIGLSFLLRPHSTPNIANQQNTTPQNELSDRQNKERPNERIPDIFGTLWSTPDLIAQPYRIFDANGVEIEYAYYCIGRGSYTIGTVRDDLTPLSQIDGASAEIYGPFTSPNAGAKQSTIGPAIGEPVRAVKPSSSVNGQTLIAPNLTGGGGWTGPYICGDANTTDIWVNFTAQSGAYQIPSATGVQAAVTVTLQIGVTPIDAAGNPTAAEVLTNVNLTGSATLKQRVGVTLKYHCASVGLQSVRARRTSNTNISANVSVSDEVQWRDLYSVDPVTQSDFGNVTTIQTLTRPTPTALALKQRKLNILVTRNIPIGALAGGVVTFGSPGPTKFAGDIFVAMATDPFIGNRQLNEVDTAEIYTTLAAVQTYFGTSLCTNFCFTFDDKAVSFEESLADIAASVFCRAYRRANIFSLSFEQKTANSKLLFNHRSKIPGSETRTVTFGLPNDIDGIQLTYTEPNDPAFPNQDVPKTITFPFTRYHINSTGGTNPIKYFADLGVSTNAHVYNLQVNVTNTGLATLRVADAFGHFVDVPSLASKQVKLTFTGDGVTHIQLWFSIVTNVADELNFDAWNPYIADAAVNTNMFATADLDFVSAVWSNFIGSTVTVTTVQPSPINPKQITSVGIRNNVQAYELGQRLYNKLRYQNTVTQFTSTQEAALSILDDRILVADNTRPDTQDGEVIDVNGLALILSQNIVFVAGRTYVIFLQHYDETVESIGITAGPVPPEFILFPDWDSTKKYRIDDRASFNGINYQAIAYNLNAEPDTNPASWQPVTVTNQVILAGAPALPLVTDRSNYAMTYYHVVSNVEARSAAFLLSEKTPQDGLQYQVKAINYDDRYYDGDDHFLKGFIKSNGESGEIGPAIAPGGTYRPSTVNDLNPASGSTGLTTSAGTVEGFDIPATPPNNFPPFSDGDPGEHEEGDVVWTGFATVRITANVTLHVVVSANSRGTIKLNVNGTITSFGFGTTGTLTAVIPAGTYLSSCSVEVTADPVFSGGGSASCTVTDIFIS